MNGIFDTAVNAFRVESIRKRLLYTFMILGIFMLGGLVPVPGIDGAEFTRVIQQWGQLGSIMDLISGGGLLHASILSLGVSPYINASIIIQLLTVVIPPLEEMSKEGEAGRKKMDKITRVSAIVLAFVQSCLFCYSTRSALNATNLPTWLNAALVVLSFTAGAAVVVFLGEKINDKGIGNGVSLIIFAGIVTRLPDMAATLYEKCVSISDSIDNAVLGALAGIGVFVLVTAISITIIVFVLYVQNAERRIPVQYSKKVIGRQTRGGNRDYIPLKVNMSGVMPVIFTMSLLAIPSIVVTLFFNNSTNAVAVWLKETFTGSPWYYLCYFFLVIGFTFFYTEINFHPVEIANSINKNGGMINGIRSGKPTTDFIKGTAFRLNWIEAFFLVLVCIVPTIIGILTGFQNVWFAGTSVLILTGVANDLIVQVEGELEIRSPKGFLEDLTIKTGRR
jgi:preprotein translocase subunit SecY